MDFASETDAMLQGLAQEATLTEIPLAEPSDVAQPSAVEEATQSEAVSMSAEPAVVQAQEQYNDGEQLDTVAATYIAVPDGAASPNGASLGAKEDTTAQLVQPASTAPAETATAQPDPGSNLQAENPAANSADDAHTNGVADTNGTVEAPPSEPERGRSRKRRARWGAPANAPAEPAADATADGEQTGRKKRRSRWEEPAPAAEESQQLAIVDMSAGSGFPHEIVLAGGIKVSYASVNMQISSCTQQAALASNVTSFRAQVVARNCHLHVFVCKLGLPS